MAFVPSLDSQEVLASGGAIAQMLQEETGLVVEPNVGTDFSAVREAMGAGQAHSILQCRELLNRQDSITVLCSLHFVDPVHRYATRGIGYLADIVILGALITCQGILALLAPLAFIWL